MSSYKCFMLTWVIWGGGYWKLANVILFEMRGMGQEIMFDSGFFNAKFL